MKVKKNSLKKLETLYRDIIEKVRKKGTKMKWYSTRSSIIITWDTRYNDWSYDKWRSLADSLRNNSHYPHYHHIYYFIHDFYEKYTQSHTIQYTHGHGASMLPHQTDIICAQSPRYHLLYDPVDQQYPDTEVSAKLHPSPQLLSTNKRPYGKFCSALTPTSK